MKKWYWSAALFFYLLLSSQLNFAQTSFTPGNLVVYRVGDGSAALTSAATKTFLVEVDTTGKTIQTISIGNSTAGQRALNSGTATTEGSLQLSADHHWLTFSGYDVAAGTASITSSASTTNPRVFAKVDVTGTINYSTAISSSSFSGVVRSVCTVDGNAFWAGTSTAGVYYLSAGTIGAGTPLATTPSNTRVASIFNNQLYTSSSSGAYQTIASVGTGMPITSGQTVTSLPGMPTVAGHSSYSFSFSPDGNTVYLADDGTASGDTYGGIQKWILVGGSWTQAGAYTFATAGGMRGLTVDWTNYNSTTQQGAIIYSLDATTSTKLIKIIDIGSSSTPVTLASAPTNTAYRGIAFAPTPASNTTLSQLTKGVATSPLIAGSTGNALLGFSISSTSAVSFTGLTMFSSADPSARFLNVKLYSSVDNDFGTTSDNSLVASGVATSTGIVFPSITESIPASTQRNYFVVADINGSVSAATPSVQLNFSDGSINITGGKIAATTITSANFAFAPPPPSITVRGTLSDFGAIAAGSTSPEQSYTVSGSNVIDALTVTAPADFQVSTTSGSGYSNSVVIPQTGGMVGATTVYVVFHPTTSTGSVTQTITNSSSGATTVNTSVSGTEIALEPTTSSTISFGTIDSSSIVVNFTGGNGGKRILVVNPGSTASFSPVDGVAPSGVNSSYQSATDQGRGSKIVYDGAGSSVTVTGLATGTQYAFAVYEYNVGTNNSQNYYTTSPGVGNANTAAVYTWNGSTSTDYQISTNWTPNRTAPAVTDILLFNSGAATSVGNLKTQTIGSLLVANNTAITLQAGTTGSVLTIAGGKGDCFDVATGSSVTVSGTNTLKLYMGAGAAAVISGSVTFTGAAHSFDAKDSAIVSVPAGIIFKSGSVFKQSTGTTGNVFTNTGTNFSVIFTSGSTFIQMAGSNPFAVTAPASKVTFQSGSLFSMQANLSPSFSGRTYGNFELNFPTAAISSSGSAGVSIDNFTVTAGAITFGMTGTANYIKGNITVAAGANLYFSPATAGTINLTGSSAQSFNIAGVCTTGTNSTIILNNANGLSLMGGRNLTVGGNLTLTSGTLSVGADTLTLSNPLGGTASNLNADATSSIAIAGTAANFILPSNVTALNNLILNNAKGTVLQNNLSLNGALTLTSGALSLGSYNLTLGNQAVVNGTPSATAQVVATGAGQLIKNVADGQSLPFTFNFPVGDSTNYTPASLTVAAGTLSSAHIGLNLTAAKHSLNTSAVDYLKRYWSVQATGLTSPSYNATFTYVPSDVNGTEANLSGLLNTNGSWSLLGAANTSTHQFTATGITNLGSFTAGQASILIVAPNAPVLVSPTNGNNKVTLPVTFKWNQSARATSYRLQVSTDFQFTQLLVNDSLITDTLKSVANLANMTPYFWRVSASNTSGESAFSSFGYFSTIGTPTSVTLVQPADLAVNQPVNVSFVWTRAFDQVNIPPAKKTVPAGTKTPFTVSGYWFELTKDTVALNSALRDTAVADTAKLVAGLDNAATYYWRVRGHNEAGWSAFTKWNSFTTIVAVPTAPVLLSPARFSNKNLLSLVAQWQSVPGAVHYRMQLATDANFNSLIVNDSLLTDTSRVLTGLSGLTNYYWRVSASNIAGEGSFSSTWSFSTIGTPVLVSMLQPLDGSVNQPTNITFIWSKSFDKSKPIPTEKSLKQPAVRLYWFELTKDTVGLSGVIRDTTLSDTTKTVTNLDNSSVYYWRVKSRNVVGWGDFNGWVVFTTIVAAPSTPILLSPANQSSGVALSLSLKWNKQANIDAYHVQLASDSAFTSLLVNDSTLTDTTKAVSGLTNNHVYYWRVSAKNFNSTSSYASAFSFTTIVALPASPAPVTPTSGVTGANSPIKFAWLKVTDAAKYQLQISSDNTFGTITFDSTSVDTAVSVKSLDSKKVYYWRVRAINAAGASAYSTVSNFTTDIKNTKALPTTFALEQNYPNPFNPSTVISYSIPRASMVNLTIFDVLGKEVAVLVNGYQNQGNYTVSFNAAQLPSGIYYYRIQADNTLLLKKMMLLK